MAEKKMKFDTKIIVLVAAVVALMLAGYVYFKQESMPLENTPPMETKPLDTPAAKLLLSAFDAGAKLEEYELTYEANENGVETAYDLRSDGNASFVNVSGGFGSLRGYFGGPNQSEVVCLSYGGDDRCALVGNDSEALSVAASLKILLPDKKTFISQKTQIIKLINIGAIKLDSSIIEEPTGAFETKKISYSLDYRSLTVDQLLSVGISPSDPSLSTISDQKVSYWVDKAGGFIVKSRATYKETLVSNSYETDYTKIKLGSPEVPGKPLGVVETPSFVSFYKRAEMDYQAKASCMVFEGNDRTICLKSLASEKRDWEICKMIGEKDEYEACTLIVAQGTNNAVLCEKLDALSDDCYIAVASQTGNFDLCKKMKNSSLINSCAQAAAAGLKKISDEEEALRKTIDYRDCGTNPDCRTFGAASQYCAPRNTTKEFANEASPLNACFKDLPCACNEGYCGFRKNNTFYKCISEVEGLELEKYINSLVNQSNSTG
ncbi:TPA: hypothetical protein HA225_06530 [Candidatus Micrarchaeota archaeon]|nr:hypothetical protein [Candidatus Micrarchaeota archaeon]HIH30982.1 hypothetical protein [Candidatus Micrarchaeota archaeon]